MNILYCGDGNTIHGVLFSILSLLENNKREMHFYIVTMESKELNIKGITESSVKFLNELVKEYNSKSSVQRFDVTKFFLDNLPEANMKTRFTPCCMLRLYVDELKLPDKFLYLDYDVVCRKPIDSFYDMDVTDLEFIGVLDYYGKWWYPKKHFRFDYINSGVLLINFKKCLETGLFKKCRTMCHDKKMLLPDQSALNKMAVLKKHVSPIYNEQKHLHSETVLQHFSTTFRFWPYFHPQSVKPWQKDRMHKLLHLYEYDDFIERFENIDRKLIDYEKRTK